MTKVDRRTLIQSVAAGSAVAAFWNSAATAENKNYYVIAELVAKPDQADTLRPLLLAFTASARKEPGCIHYSFLEDVKQPGRFLTFEKWTDAAALEGHMHMPEIQALGPKLGPLLAKPFTQIFLSMLSE